MKPFVINRSGRLVLPSNIFPELDFSVLESLEQFAAVIKRDFSEKAPTGSDILARIDARAYGTRYDLLRDLSLNLFWVNRYSITMYEKRPTAWRHVPKHRDDVFLPIVTPWSDAGQKVAAVENEFRRLPPCWSSKVEERIFRTLFEIYAHRRHDAVDLPVIKPTVSESLENPESLTFLIRGYDPDYPTFSREQIVDSGEEVPELEALMRWAMVLHNQYPWHRQHTELIEVSKLEPDDVVALFVPRNREVLQFIRRVNEHAAAVAGGAPARARQRFVAESQGPPRPYPPVEVRKHFAVMPLIQSLAVVKGEVVCTNEDLVRNAAYNWSPMTAQEIVDKTGIEQRLYTARTLEEISLEAAQRALEQAGCDAREIGAVIFCTCTSTRLMPSVATWLCGELGIMQTHVSCDMVAACAGMAYGLSECVRVLQEVRRPVLLVCAEKFSDKIGSVRTSRMIFGDGAGALVIGPAPAGAPPDIEVLQTYASGTHQEVNAIVWPNPSFDNSITVYGPDVQTLVRRYIVQMIEELRALPDPDDERVRLMDSIELVVPHQANRTMVVKLATAAGLSPDQLYFNIDKVGNTSAASIPIALSDAVHSGVITRPTRVFAPGFGAGAVGGYAVMRIDPSIVAPEVIAQEAEASQAGYSVREGSIPDGVQDAFGS